MSDLIIKNGEVYDPANGIDGARLTIHIKDGLIASDAADDAEIIDATGFVIMPGMIDIHTHIAGPKADAAYISSVEGAARWRFPSSRHIGLEYSAMGYTTLVDPAIHPYSAYEAHKAAMAVPQTDKALLAVLDDTGPALEMIDKNEKEKLRAFISWVVNATLSYSVKLVNPGGRLLPGGARRRHGLDEALNGSSVTPRRIITSVADAMAELGLPHPIHLHVNNLGLRDCHKTVIETLNALEGRKAHIAHMQFYSYSSEGPRGFSSAAPVIADAVNANPDIVFDVGQIVFGPTMTVTGDERLASRLRKLAGGGVDGVMRYTPYEYNRESYVNSVQWTAGLELALLVEDPWRIALTVDYPNGGSYKAYPDIIRALTDSAFRREELGRINQDAAARAPLKDISREYTLYEIAVITSAAPARSLGLTRKGRLSPGADADLILYRKGGDKGSMFAEPAMVIKDGKIIVKDGETVKETRGKTFYASPPLRAEDEILFIKTFNPEGRPGLPVPRSAITAAVEA